MLVKIMAEITVPLTLHPISTCLIPPHPPAFTSSRKPSLTLWMKLGRLSCVPPAPCLPSLQCSSHSICLKCIFLKSFQKIPRGEPTRRSLLTYLGVLTGKARVLWNHSPSSHTDSLNSKCSSSFFKDLPQPGTQQFACFSFYFVSIF